MPDLPVLSSLQGKISAYIGAAEPYEGAVTVEPDPYVPVTLQTANKLLTQNITITKIPTSEVVNPDGGTTFIIG